MAGAVPGELLAETTTDWENFTQIKESSLNPWLKFVIRLSLSVPGWKALVCGSGEHGLACFTCCDPTLKWYLVGFMWVINDKTGRKKGKNDIRAKNVRSESTDELKCWTLRSPSRFVSSWFCMSLVARRSLMRSLLCVCIFLAGSTTVRMFASSQR